METCDLLVIGGGAAGMAAALSASEAGAGKILLVERDAHLGGVLNQCTHHGFGLGWFHEDLTGREYAARFRERFPAPGVTVRCDTTALSLRPERTALLSSPAGVGRVAFSRCVLAAGCRERAAQSLPVCGTRPAGVLTAGTAQRLVNVGGWDVGREIVILGSGDVGQIMARRFAQLGKRVVAMVEQNARLGGLARNRRDCVEAYHIPVILNATVDEIRGERRVEGVFVKRLDTGAREFLPCDTLVTALGLIPERELLAALPEIPDWLRLCGNCGHVHEIVDTVTAEAVKTGASILF